MPHLLYIQLEGVDELADEAWRIGMKPEQIREGAAEYGGFFKVKGNSLRRAEEDPRLHVVHAKLDVNESSNLRGIFGNTGGYWPHAHLTDHRILQLRVRGEHGYLRMENGLEEMTQRLRQVRRDAISHKPAPTRRTAPWLAYGLDLLQYAVGNRDSLPLWQCYSRKG